MTALHTHLLMSVKIKPGSISLSASKHHLQVVSSLKLGVIVGRDLTLVASADRPRKSREAIDDLKLSEALLLVDGRSSINRGSQT